MDIITVLAARLITGIILGIIICVPLAIFIDTSLLGGIVGTAVAFLIFGPMEA